MIEAGVAAASGRPRARPTDGPERGGWKAWADHRGRLGEGESGGKRGRRRRRGREREGARRGKAGEGDREGEEEEKKKRGVINPLTS